MRLKRLIASLVLCAAILAMALPVSAASSFSDVSDPNTAVNADILRLMGVVSGSGGNNFSPSAQLTRAEFCVMAVKAMGRDDEVPIHTTRTIFSDVTARHWARGYINLISSIPVGDNAEKAGGRLISSSGTGLFRPDDQITYAEAVTILMRILGYGDSKVGAVWPAGYLNMASSLGLTKGLTGISSGASVTRAQAAQLFVNMLSTKTSGGEKYYNTLGTPTENVILLALNVTGDDSAPGAIRTSKGTYHPAVDGVSPTALLGRRGVLVLNDHQEISAFIPDSSTAVTVTLSGDAQATSLKASSGTRYSIESSTPAFTSSTDEPDTTYSKIWMDLTSGSQVTLFLDGGKVIGVYYAAGGRTAAEALVVTGPVSTETFHNLTGGAEDFSIQKNRQSIRLADIQPYDVVTYDSMTNTLIVSDLRLSCVYEKATPNTATPTSITVLGHEFEVLSSALDTVGKFSVGKSVTLLLTADGSIAGMMEPSAKYRSTAIGMVSGGGVEMLLPSGGTIELTSSESLPEALNNQLVSVSSYRSGVISATRMSDRNVGGSLNLDKMTLNSYTVTAGVAIFERVSTSSVVRLNLSDLRGQTIPGDKIATYHLNSSGMVDVIVLNAATGDAYQYGQFLVRAGNEDNDVSARLLYFSNSNGTVQLNEGAGARKDGDFVGVALDGSRLLGTVKLTAVKGVSRSDFFTSKGVTFVEANGTVYTVSDNVEGYRSDGKTWVTSDDVVSEIRAYSNDLTIYIDSIAQKVRIIVAD